MAAPRLPFLWPMLFRPLQVPRAVTRIPIRKAPLSRRLTTTTTIHAQGPVQRYGTAHEPASRSCEQEASKEDDSLEKSREKESIVESAEEEEEEGQPLTATPSTPSSQPTSTTPESAPTTPAPEPPKVGDPTPLVTVLQMPNPAEEGQHKSPHLKTPPYVHHFDTYGLVKDLAKSSFSEEQAVTVMKAVRGILADNMELARDGLISKSNVENETYLFRAACSELRTEVGNNRKAETEKMRTERTQVQHELDILNQRLAQETASLKDELKGLFDDRKMAVRQEQRTMDTKIQELNYKITVVLNSDARSEVESLRWVLTRRAAMTVGISAFMLFVSLQYSSYLSRQEAEENKKAQGRRPPLDDGQSGDQNGLSFSNYNTSTKDDPVGEELVAIEGGVTLA